MGTGFAKKKKEARRMQEQFARLQEELLHAEFVGTAAGGLVTVTLNGEGNLLKVKINPSCVDKEEVEALEDLITVAHKDAEAKIKAKGEAAGLPNLENLPPMSF